MRALLLMLFLPTLAWGAADVDTLYPDADGATIDWVPNAGCTNEWECIASNDDGTSFVTANANNLRQQAQISWSPSNFSSVDSVVIWIRSTEVGTATKRVSYGVLSGATRSEPDTASYSSGAYQTNRGTKFTADPADAGAWTQADINGLVLSFTSVDGFTATRTVNTTVISAIVYWQNTITGSTLIMLGD